MINGISALLTNPVLSNIAQSTTASVSIETGLKAVGRPSFILADSKIEPQTKRYAAMKEFLYQVTCLATYMAIVVPIFKNGSFKLAQKYFKDEPGFKMFKNAGNYLKYHKLSTLPMQERLKILETDKYKTEFTDEIRQILLKEEKPNPQNLIKGVVEFGNTVGSVLGLAIFAPQVSHLIIHPVLKYFDKMHDVDNLQDKKV